MACGMVGIAPSVGDAFIQAGTTEIAGALVPVDHQPARPDALIRLPYPDGSPSDDTGELSLIYGSTSNGGMSLTWLETQLEIDLQDDALWADAQRLPSDPAGLLFVPHIAGARAPLWRDDATGGWVGDPADASPARKLRAVLEGCALSKRSVLEAAGVANPPRLLVAGGGARRAVSNQIRAAVLNAPTVARSATEVTAAGAIAMALDRVGPTSSHAGRRWLSQLHDAAGDRTFAPPAEHALVYDRLYTHYLEYERRMVPQRAR